MKSFKAEHGGNIDVLHLVDSPIPDLAENEVLIKTRYCSVNPVDYKILTTDRFGIKYPYTPGLDVSGVIEKVGSSVRKLKAGDEVLAKLPIARSGGYAENSIAAESLAIKKGEMSFEEAAAFPLVSLTAWQALFDHGGLKSGQKVLILGGAGGVGMFAVQFAHNAGAVVTTTSSGKNAARLEELGADKVIDYTKERFYEVMQQDQDLVVDAIGNDESAQHATDVLKRGGVLVSITRPSVGSRVDSGEVTALHFMTKDDGAQLQHITDLINEERVKVVVAKVFEFSELPKALELLKEGHVNGKLVVRVS